MLGQQPVATLHTHSAAVRDCQWVSSTHIVSGGYDQVAIYTDMHTQTPVHTFTHNAVVSALTRHPTDPNIFFTGSSAKRVQSWDLRTHKSVNTYIGAGFCCCGKSTLMFNIMLLLPSTNVVCAQLKLVSPFIVATTSFHPSIS